MKLLGEGVVVLLVVPEEGLGGPELAGEVVDAGFQGEGVLGAAGWVAGVRPGGAGEVVPGGQGRGLEVCVFHYNTLIVISWRRGLLGWRSWGCCCWSGR